MNKLIITSLFVLFLLGSCSSQKKSLIESKMQSADSIVLISHIVTKEYAAAPKPDWDARDTTMNMEKYMELHPPAPPFLKDGQINRAIITEAVKIDKERDALKSILIRHVTNVDSSKFNCDIPQHTIVLYKSGKQSFIDLCFTCRKVHPSSDIEISEKDFDENKWNSLKSFFQNVGIKENFELE